MRWWLAGSLVVCLTMLSCGPRSPAEPSPSPDALRDLATGLEVIAIATEAFSDADKVLTISLSFPRLGGTAEFWKVTLGNPGGEFRSIEIQGRRVVGSETLQPRFPPGVEATAIEELTFDTDEAEALLRDLPPVTEEEELSVSLSPIALDVADQDVPEGARGAPAWRFWITQNGSVLVQTVWVSARDGSVLSRSQER